MTSGGVLSAILASQSDDVLVDLKRQLERRIAEARGALAQSETELGLVEQAIAARAHREPRADGSSSTDLAERDREPDGRFQGIPRARILAVASALPDTITPARVVEAFAERGETVNVEQIRVALNRLAKDGNLTKVAPSRFEVPAGQSSEFDSAPQQQEPASGTEVARDPFRRGVLGTSLSGDAYQQGP